MTKQKSILEVELFGQETALNKEMGKEGADRCDQGDGGSGPGSAVCT